MVEFTGYLTGKAEKHFARKGSSFARNIFLVGAGLLAPVIISFIIYTKSTLLLGVYFAAIVSIVVFSLIPKSKKELKSITPKRIYTDGESITCVADKYVETRFIHDVKEVHDCGEYYDLIFPFGKISEKFICQKSLLTNGSLKEFENLFENRIKR